MVFINIGQKKLLAALLIGLGIFIIVPGFHYAIINFPLAKALSTSVNLSYSNSLVLVSVIIPLVLIWVGLLLYPTLTFNKSASTLSSALSEFIHKLKTDRTTQIVTLMLIFVIYQIFQTYSLQIHAALGS